MQLLRNVTENFLLSKTSVNGKAVKPSTIDQRALLIDLPKLFSDFLEEKKRAEEFLVKGSYGNGVITQVPWVAVLNKSVTTTPQNGYYIVLLFGEDMRCCYLSLNQGVTEFMEKYRRRIALRKIKESAVAAHKFLIPTDKSLEGEIDLSASGMRGKGYERGAVLSFKYDVTNLPTVATFKENFFYLLSLYDKLHAVAGNSLQNLVTISEAEYQSAAIENTSSTVQQSVVDDGGPEPAPKKQQGSSFKAFQRNPIVAAKAISLAKFKCELDPSHATFISSAKGTPYVEAHHLIPIYAQPAFDSSLDVQANIIALCPLCHKLLHHGLPSDKRAFLEKLYEIRLPRLILKGLYLDKNALYSYYKDDLLEEGS